MKVFVFSAFILITIVVQAKPRKLIPITKEMEDACGKQVYNSEFGADSCAKVGLLHFDHANFDKAIQFWSMSSSYNETTSLLIIGSRKGTDEQELEALKHFCKTERLVFDEKISALRAKNCISEMKAVPKAIRTKAVSIFRKLFKETVSKK